LGWVTSPVYGHIEYLGHGLLLGLPHYLVQNDEHMQYITSMIFEQTGHIIWGLHGLPHCLDIYHINPFPPNIKHPLETMV
jgi:hypothetical protein